MITTPISLQDLRRKIYAKAKAEPQWRFWGLYVHVCKMETLRAAYAMAKANDGAPGSDGVSFEAIEERGVEGFLEQIRDELTERTYVPLRARKKEIPKEGSNKVRTLSIPCIRDRVVQGALKLIVEPIFEADFQPGSFGYRPKRTAHQALIRVADAIVVGKTRVIDIDLKAYFDGVRHDVLLAKGQVYLSPAIASIVVEGYRAKRADAGESAFSQLTPKEREIVQLLAEGHSTKEIAARLSVSAKTVGTHREHIMGKLQLHSIAQLTRYAIREGLTSLETSRGDQPGRAGSPR